MNKTKAERGVLYITSNDLLMDEAIISARSVVEHNPDIRVGVVTDEPVEYDVFDDVFVTELAAGFEDKSAEMRIPYQKTMYLDTDTLIDGSLHPVFELLDEFDIAAAHNYSNSSRETYENDHIPDGFPEYNTGVIGFRDSDAAQEFIEEWEVTFRENTHLRPGDQPSFRSVLYESDIRIATIPPEYNCMFRYPGCAVDDIVVFHGRLIDVNSEGAERFYDAHRAKRELNGYELTRAFAPRTIGGFKIIQSPTEYLKIRRVYEDKGLIGVYKGAVKKIRRSYKSLGRG
jgi:hypothetical protein